MKTDDLIAGLALDLPPAPAGQLERRLMLFMAPASALVLAAVVAWLGLRPDLMPAMAGPTFWAKAAYTATLAVGAFWLLGRLGRPGASPRIPLIVLGLVAAAAAAAAVVELTMAAPDARMAMTLGSSSPMCLVRILGLSAVAAPFVFVAARRFAPVRPAAAGAAAGLLTGALAATLYGLHCAEHTAAFVALWYSLGMALAAGGGAVIGRFAFRW